MEEVHIKEIKIAVVERLEQLKELFRRKQYIKHVFERTCFVISSGYSLFPSNKRY